LDSSSASRNPPFLDLQNLRECWWIRIKIPS
jgi:hypothetical protein